MTGKTGLEAFCWEFAGLKRHKAEKKGNNDLNRTYGQPNLYIYGSDTDRGMYWWKVEKYIETKRKPRFAVTVLTRVHSKTANPITPEVEKNVTEFFCRYVFNFLELF